jgi:hypothetical protein
VNIERPAQGTLGVKGPELAAGHTHTFIQQGIQY